MCFQNEVNLKFIRSLIEAELTDFIEFINSSYIPVINAIVPPDTPGIISAIPMNKPLRYKSILNFIN
jgi:hypothetical protein